MKRGTPKHPKVYDLCERLRCDRPTALGYLELLWHFAAEFAPQGDIGKFSDKRIEGALDWKTGRWRKSGDLVQALIGAGWIDISTSSGMCQEFISGASAGDQTGSGPYHRLVIHDWHVHCDDSVRKKLARSNLSFLSLGEKVTGQSADADRKMSATQDENGSLPLPCLALALPEPHTQRVRVTPCASDLTGQTSERFEEFWNRYPRKQHRDAACHAWISVVTVDTEAAVESCLMRYLESDEVARGVCQNPENWLMEQHRDNWAGEWPKPRAAPAMARKSNAERMLDEASEILSRDEEYSRGRIG
jgi:hypothetical protein